MQNRLLLLVIILVSTLKCYSQDRSNYKLLWEITKGDESLKSYVFGTMHLQDERVFKFSDSVIPAIENTDVFALELDPTLFGDALTERFNELEGEDNIYKKILSKEEYERLSERFLEVNGSSIEDYPMAHPLMIESALSPTFKNETDKRTFLDVYLFGIANHFSKEITGLERIEDQFPKIDAMPTDEIRETILRLIDLDEEEAKQQQERLIELYYNGSLEEIYYLVNGLGSIDAVMKKRNKKIVQSMDSIMKSKTIFAGIGAAHLPGTNGVLDLLEKKGYTVKFVTPTFNSPEFFYDLTLNIETWKDNKNNQAGYSVKTPGDVLAMPMGESVESYTAADLYSGSSFTYFHVDYRNSEYDSSESIIDKIIENQLTDQNAQLLERREVQIDGKIGTETIMKMGDETMRAQYFEIENILYSFLIENKRKELRTAYSDAFFNSIRFFEPEAPKPVWEWKNDDLGAYSIKTKGPITNLSKTTTAPDNPDAIHELFMYSTADEENGTFSIVRYNNQPDGYYLNNIAVFDKEVLGLLNSKGKVIDGPIAIERDGVKGASYEVIFSEIYHARAEAYFRGNRFHLLLTQNIEKDTKVPVDDVFIKSFRFEPYQAIKLDTVLTIENRYQVKLPQHSVKTDTAVYSYTDGYSANLGYTALDEATGGSYVFQWIETKPYLKAESLDKFYDFYTEELLEYNDSIVSSKKSLLGGLPSRQMIVHNKSTHVRQKMELLLDGQNLILLLAYVGDAELERVDQYFQSFKPLGKQSNFVLEASKMDLITKNLKSEDSIVFESAKGAFDYYVFNKKEEKQLIALLKQRYPDDGENRNVKNLIINELVTINSKKTLKTLVNFYNSDYATNENKIKILEVLPKLATDDAYEKLFALIKTNPPLRLKDSEYPVFNGLNTKPEVVVERSEELLSLLNKEDFRDKIIKLFSYHISYDSINAPKLRSHSDRLLSYFEEDAKKYNDTLQRNASSSVNFELISNYLNITKALESVSPSAENALMIIAESPEKESWVSLRALNMAIHRNMIIPPYLIKDKLEALYSRYEVMETLIENKNIEQIPSAYLDVIEFGKLSLYNASGQDSGYYPDTINYLGELFYNNASYLVYSYLNEAVNYLGVVKKEVPNVAALKPFAVSMNWVEYNGEDWEQEAVNTLKAE